MYLWKGRYFSTNPDTWSPQGSREYWDLRPGTVTITHMATHADSWWVFWCLAHYVLLSSPPNGFQTILPRSSHPLSLTRPFLYCFTRCLWQRNVSNDSNWNETSLNGRAWAFINSISYLRPVVISSEEFGWDVGSLSCRCLWLTKYLNSLLGLEASTLPDPSPLLQPQGHTAHLPETHITQWVQLRFCFWSMPGTRDAFVPSACPAWCAFLFQSKAVPPAFVDLPPLSWLLLPSCSQGPLFSRSCIMMYYSDSALRSPLTESAGEFIHSWIISLITESLLCPRQGGWSQGQMLY